MKAITDTICVLGCGTWNGCKFLNSIILCIQMDRQKTTRPFNLEIPTVLNTVALQWFQLSPFLRALTSHCLQWSNSASAGRFSYLWPYRLGSKCSLVFSLYCGTLGFGWFLPHIHGSFVKLSVVCKRVFKLRFLMYNCMRSILDIWRNGMKYGSHTNINGVSSPKTMCMCVFLKICIICLSLWLWNV